jgi:catechol 2,3-dioxygenase-like lactoylglutathione lyase family enzyme
MVTSSIPRKIRHTGIVVTDMDSALKIYTEFLGFELLNLYPKISNLYIETLLGIKNASIKVAILNAADQSRIELIEYTNEVGKKREPVLANDIGASHFAITVSDIDHLYLKHSEYNVKFIAPPQVSPEGFVKVAYVILMDECIVELVEVLDERAATTK